MAVMTGVSGPLLAAPEAMTPEITPVDALNAEPAGQPLGGTGERQARTGWRESDGGPLGALLRGQSGDGDGIGHVPGEHCGVGIDAVGDGGIEDLGISVAGGDGAGDDADGADSQAVGQTAAKNNGSWLVPGSFYFLVYCSRCRGTRRAS